MKLRNLFLGTIFSIVASTSIFAVSLEDVSSALAKNRYTTGNFNQIKTMKASGRSLKSSGTFVFGLDGIVWNTLKPFPSTMAITKERIIQTSKDGSQTVIEAAGNDVFGSVASTLTAVFSNDLNLLKQNFTTEFKDNGNGTWTLVLVPKDSTIKSVLNSLLLEGKCGSTVSLDAITMTEPSENTIRYEFNDQKYPKELTADEKAFFVVK